MGAGRMTREECKCLQELTEGIDAEQLEDLSVTSFIGLTVGCVVDEVAVVDLFQVCDETSGQEANQNEERGTPCSQ